MLCLPTSFKSLAGTVGVCSASWLWLDHKSNLTCLPLRKYRNQLQIRRRCVVKKQNNSNYRSKIIKQNKKQTKNKQVINSWALYLDLEDLRVDLTEGGGNNSPRIYRNFKFCP